MKKKSLESEPKPAGRLPPVHGVGDNDIRVDGANPLETRVTQIEGNLNDLREGMKTLLDALNKPQNGQGGPAQNGAPQQVPSAPPQWSTPSQPQPQNGGMNLTSAIEAIKALDGMDKSNTGGQITGNPMFDNMVMTMFKGYADMQAMLTRVALDRLTTPAVPGVAPRA